MSSFHHRRWVALAILLPFAVALVLHARHYLPFVSDDALISLRYARRLLGGYGLTWTDGQRVEGYSNLLWILLVAAAGSLGIDLILAARVLGAACMIAAMAAVAFAAVRKYPARVVWLPLVVAMTFLSAGAPMAVWAIGALEQPLYGALLAIALGAMYALIDEHSGGARRAAAIALGLLCLTRPDGPLFTVSCAPGLLLARRFRRGAFAEALPLVAVPAAFSIAQIAFRVMYYREFVPNTALVKLTPSALHAAAGWRYLAGGVRSLEPLSGIAIGCLILLVVLQRSRGRGIVLALTAVLWSAYVVSIGGDIFPAYRHLVPLMIVGAFAIADGLAIVCERYATRGLAQASAAVAAIALCVPYVRAQSSDPQALRAMRERWEWQGRDLALTLRDAFGHERPRMAVTAAGCLPYWSEFASLDMMGLNDYYIARHPPSNLGLGPLGHEFGDGAYVLSQAPDLIVFNVGSTPMYRSGDQLQALTEFRSRYVPVAVRPKGSDDVYTVYMDKYSDRIGMRYTRAGIVLPAFAFEGDGAVAVLNPAKQLVIRVPPAGTVRATIDAAVLPASVDVEVDASDPSHVASSVDRTGGTVIVTIRSTSTEPLDVRRVMLTDSR